MNLNRVFIAGNLTRDVELRATPSGTQVAQIGLAINRVWKDQAGEKKEEVTFVDCEAWGKTAEVMAQYLGKGKPVFIEGRMKLEQWEDKESGQKRSKMKVVVESFQFVESKGKTDGGGEPVAAGVKSKPAFKQPGTELDPSEIPF